MDQHFATIGLRAWWAWNCLPRDKFGRAPELRPLERKHGLSNGQLRRLIFDITRRPGYSTVKKAADALGCSPDWLAENVGSPPLARYPIPPRPLPAQSISETDVAGAAEELAKAARDRAKAVRRANQNSD